jgi:hypothetical protein
MSKKHFIVIAAAIRAELTDANRETFGRLADELSRQFAVVNPNFDRSRFLTACGF